MPTPNKCCERCAILNSHCIDVHCPCHSQTPDEWDGKKTPEWICHICKQYYFLCKCNSQTPDEIKEFRSRFEKVFEIDELTLNRNIQLKKSRELIESFWLAKLYLSNLALLEKVEGEVPVGKGFNMKVDDYLKIIEQCQNFDDAFDAGLVYARNQVKEIIKKLKTNI